MYLYALIFIFSLIDFSYLFSRNYLTLIIIITFLCIISVYFICRNLEVDVRFAYVTSLDADKPEFWMDMKFAIFKFRRRYGDHMKDSQWIVTDFKHPRNKLAFVKLRNKKK